MLAMQTQDIDLTAAWRCVSARYNRWIKSQQDADRRAYEAAQRDFEIIKRHAMGDF